MQTTYSKLKWCHAYTILLPKVMTTSIHALNEMVSEHHVPVSGQVIGLKLFGIFGVACATQTKCT